MGIARSHDGRLSARMREEVEAVIARDELAPVFQPVIDLRTGLVAGYEALARFTRGRRRPTAEWFAEAHRCGIGLRLEAHAAATALSVGRRPFGSFLALNLSPAALASADVQAVLPARLDGIVIDVTGQGPEQPDEVLRSLRRDIRSRGGRLALDLAGSDYAGLRHLMWSAPDVLKLDRALVHRIHADPAKAVLVEVLVRYARELGVAVCAEGVETLEDLERLAELDVVYAQGHAVGRPAKPWQSADPAAARTCTSSVAASVTGSHGDPGALGIDGRLQWLAWRLSEATTYGELSEAVAAIQQELAADDLLISIIDGGELVVVGAGGPDRLDDRYVIEHYPETARLLREQDTSQVLVSDPDAEPSEIEVLRKVGYRSLLMLPVSCAGRAIGLFEAYRRDEMPWSRFEIGRARIIALQLGAALERISRA
ncbi:MAG TPA: EAL domain-containing protein [Solirubrobacteraceae bacterium]|nr:EAL domain-containing protein [Solirubrobacteraceae bacterium]